jgi:hypothetical protein
MTPDELAHGMLTVNGDGAYHVELTAPGGPPVVLGPFPNLDVAKATADAVRGFVAAAIRAGQDAQWPPRGGDPAAGPAGERK